MRHLFFGCVLGLASFGPALAQSSSPDTPGSGTGLTATYYNNGTLAGAPVLSRLDAAVDFEWGTIPPAPGVREDNFSVRWEGQIEAPVTGRYKFSTLSNDGVRVWINGKKIIDNWTKHAATVNTSAAVNLAAGQRTSIKVEYYDEDGEATIRLQWVPPGQAAQTVPQSQLYPLGSATSAPVLAGATPAPAPTPAPQPAPAPAPTPAPVAAAPAPEPKPAKTPKAPKQPKAVAQAEPKPEPKAEPKPEPKPEPAPAAAAAAPIGPASFPGVFTLRSRADGKPLLVVDESQPNAALRSSSTEPVATTVPQWRIESSGDGYYRLIVQGGRKVLEVLGSSTSNGAPLSLWPYYSGNNQQWKIEDAGSGYYKLTPKHAPKKSLTAADPANVDQPGPFQQRYAEKMTQQWKLEPVAETTSPALAGVTPTPGVGRYKLAVYPNPSNGVVQMAYQLTEDLPLGWVLYDQRGAAVRVSDYRRQPAGPHHQTIDFRGLPAGDYNLNLTVGTTTTRQSVSIRRPTAAEEASTPASAGNAE